MEISYAEIRDGRDVLRGMSFREAAACCPEAIEALWMQRLGRPFLLLALRLSRPWVSVEQADGQIEEAMAKRSNSIRSISGLIESDISSWRGNSRLIIDHLTTETEEAGRVRAAMVKNMDDIRRAFSECRHVYDTAAAVNPDNRMAWTKGSVLVDNMEAVVRALTEGVSTYSDGDITDEIVQYGAQYGCDTDRFGAASLGLPAAQFAGSQWIHDEYILSGHRAPSVGLPEYRRMGGRVF